MDEEFNDGLHHLRDCEFWQSVLYHRKPFAACTCKLKERRDALVRQRELQETAREIAGVPVEADQED